MQKEAEERGISVLRVEQEYLEAEWERRQADSARVQAMINDPATLRRLRRMWAGEQLPPEPEPAPPRDPNAPPSSGRIISRRGARHQQQHQEERNGQQEVEFSAQEERHRVRSLAAYACAGACALPGGDVPQPPTSGGQVAGQAEDAHIQETVAARPSRAPALSCKACSRMTPGWASALGRAGGGHTPVAREIGGPARSSMLINCAQSSVIETLTTSPPNASE